jgi:ribosomal protein L40E
MCEEGRSEGGRSRANNVLVNLASFLGYQWCATTRRREHLLTVDEVNSEEHTFRIKTCLRCRESNSPTSGFCSRCGCPLDVRTAMLLHEEESKTDYIMDWLAVDPEFKEVVWSRLKALAMAMTA